MWKVKIKSNCTKWKWESFEKTANFISSSQKIHDNRLFSFILDYIDKEISW